LKWGLDPYAADSYSVPVYFYLWKKIGVTFLKATGICI
jgi:hypothetical protein